MGGSRPDPVLRAILTVLGAVAVVAGLYGVATGIDGMAGNSAGTTNVDSELRFFAVLWVAYGVIVLRTAPRAHRELTTVRALMLVLFCTGLARVVAWIDEGRPDSMYLILLALELSVPILVLTLQARMPARVP
jgi:hypothetical protein